MVLNEKFLFSFLAKLNCFENKPHLAVGVSGGPDSMALAYLLNRWVKFKKGKLSALVFNHSIRDNSQKESHYVKTMLDDLKIESFIINAKKNKLNKKNMAQARSNRFEGLMSFCKKKNILHLFLGHHFDDNLETYLIRKLSGSNLEGLGAMNNIAHFNNVQILRPLILTSKLSILSFNNKNKVNFIKDPSNQDISYTRVKVRNFLQNKHYKKKIINDFIYLKKKIPDYKKMVWDLFHNTLIQVQPKIIKVSFVKLIRLDELIIEKHILLILKFFSSKQNLPKSSKISILINSMKNPRFKIFNLSGVIIEKNSEFLIFSHK